ncbi:hypothetical protein TcWFU_006008 [Taenia crassiceps]
MVMHQNSKQEELKLASLMIIDCGSVRSFLGIISKVNAAVHKGSGSAVLVAISASICGYAEGGMTPSPLHVLSHPRSLSLSSSFCLHSIPHGQTIHGGAFN